MQLRRTSCVVARDQVTLTNVSRAEVGRWGRPVARLEASGITTTS